MKDNDGNLLYLTDNEKAKLPAFVSLVKDSHEKNNKTYYYTDLQYAEYKPFFWGKSAKYGECNDVEHYLMRYNPFCSMVVNL